MNSNRREFLASTGLAAVPALRGPAALKIVIEASPDAGFKRRLAENELLRGLRGLHPGVDVRFASPALDRAEVAVLRLRIEPSKFSNAESYAILASDSGAVLSAASEQALLYAVFDFLERQGVFFGIDGPCYPLAPPAGLVLPGNRQEWKGQPRFSVRGLLPWPDFLNCITVYNEEDFRAYFEAMLRMRLNTFGMHVYTAGGQSAESYLSLEFAGVGHLAFLDTSATQRCGYIPQRTSRYKMGAGQLFDGEVFGSDATRMGRNPWEIAERTRALLQGGLRHAERLGIRTGIGFEPYRIPEEIWRALPPEVRLPATRTNTARFDVESRTGKRLLEARLGQLLEAYPNAADIWLWEDEGMTWDSRKEGIPLSPTPFLQAHEFLRRHAPGKRLVLSGWGGVVRHFEDLHRKLPEDIAFSALSDSVGWDPVHEVFGKLEGRERWPIPWLEDDPGMWEVQLHVNRWKADLDRAAGFGCQGVFGIHWRHRIVDPNAGFQARASWEPGLQPAQFYNAYASTQAAGARALRLAEVLNDADRDRKLLSTWTGKIIDGHAENCGFSADFNEAFAFWHKWEPQAAVMRSQREVHAALATIAAGASSTLERERLGYLLGHIGFMVAYADAYSFAYHIQLFLDQAAELKKGGKSWDAADLVRRECLPRWLKMAPKVREAVLGFQRIVATRNDLGTVASMQNKVVRLAFVRLPLSFEEYLGELPAEVRESMASGIAPDAAAAPRVFLPTRPTMLATGEKVRVTIVAPGNEPVRRVALLTRLDGANEWTSNVAQPLGRRTYAAMLGPFGAGARLAEYFAVVETVTGRVNALTFQLTLI